MPQDANAKSAKITELQIISAVYRHSLPSQLYGELEGLNPSRHLHTKLPSLSTQVVVAASQGEASHSFMSEKYWSYDIIVINPNSLAANHNLSVTPNIN